MAARCSYGSARKSLYLLYICYACQVGLEKIESRSFQVVSWSSARLAKMFRAHVTPSRTAVSRRGARQVPGARGGLRARAAAGDGRVGCGRHGASAAHWGLPFRRPHLAQPPRRRARAAARPPLSPALAAQPRGAGAAREGPCCRGLWPGIACGPATATCALLSATLLQRKAEREGAALLRPAPDLVQNSTRLTRLAVPYGSISR